LKAQLSSTTSSIFHREDLDMLRLIIVDRSFTYARVLHLCNRDPFWEFGALVNNPEECPLDMIKVLPGAFVASIVALLLMLQVVGFMAHECNVLPKLAQMRPLDILTPLISLYTTLADYAWLALLKLNEVHPFHDIVFIVVACHLLLCFVTNAMAIRMTLTAHLLDTPWWRRNRKRLRTVLFLSALNPRFFRITRCSFCGFDQTQIHFGTPSKMAIVFANLGLVTLFQDIPQVLVQVYVWLIWRSAAPRITFFCFMMAALSLTTSALHHIFGRSQRAAYERVVKLLGVRRLTAGFFDVNSGGAAQGLGQLEGMRRADGNADALAATSQYGNDGQILPREGKIDPAKLDPIQAALYVAQMYEKELKQSQKEAAQQDGMEGGDDEEGSDKSDQSEA